MSGSRDRRHPLRLRRVMTGLIFHLIPHTHWDREWYLPRCAFQARLVAVMDELIERLQAHPKYRSFLLDGQTVLIEDYLRARPDREADLRALVKTGRLQVGPWYVLPDEQIPSGEGLLRNLLLGAADAERLGGRLDVLYSPDAFGHPAAWPTLAREFGIRYGVVWRGLGGEAGQERDLYRWRGLDGKEILLWHLPPAGYELGVSLPADRDRLIAAWAPVRSVLVQRAAGKHIPVFIGADHHAAHPDVPQLRDLLAELDPQSAFRVSRLDEFFQAAADAAKPAPVAGALRWSYRYASTLQAVHGPRAPGGLAAPTPTLVVWNPAARPRRGVMIADVTLFRRDVPVGTPSPGQREPRQVQGYRPFALRTAEGRTLPVQVLDRRVATERLDAARHYPDQDEVDAVRIAFRAPSVPGLGFATFGLTGAATTRAGARPAAEGAVVTGLSLVNHWVEVALESTGALGLHDRRSGQRYAGLLRIEDGGDAGDTYTYCPSAGERLMQAAGPIIVRRLAAGPLVAALEARFEARGQAGLRLVVMLYADSPIVRCILDVENRATWHRLRARVPLGLAGSVALAGTAFGSVARAPVAIPATAYPLETPVRTAPAHGFVAAASGARGLALLAPAFFEYEWTVRGDLLVTLLRAVGELSRGDLLTRPGHAGWPTPTPLAQCTGRTRVEHASAPSSEAELERGDALPALWEDAFLPLRGFWLRDAVEPAVTPVDIALEGSGLVLSTVKPAQQGSPLVLRCYNATDRKTAGVWRFG